MEDNFDRVVRSNQEKSNLKVWEYPFFKDYLISQARGNEFLLPKDQFPDNEIRLSDSWHEIAQKMQNNTSLTGREWWSIIGVDSLGGKLFLNEELQEGEHHKVGIWTIIGNDVLAKDKGIDVPLGGIHSHPRSKEQRDGGVFDELNDIFVDLIPSKNDAQFSLGDLMTVINSKDSRNILGLVEANQIMLAMKTKDTLTLASHLNDVKPDDLLKIWYEANGYRVLRDKTGRIELVKFRNDAPDNGKLNNKFAEAYGLVLFKGSIGSPLKRVD